MKKIKILIAILCILTASSVALAQTYVSGTIKDSKGESIPGAVVTIDSSSNIGTMTDLDGKYTLTVPASVKDPVICANCLGYKEVREPLSGRSEIHFVLIEDSVELDELVVVGYGSMRKSDLTGSISSIRIDDENADRSRSLDQLLQGRAAGVQVINNGGSPDGGVTLRVRGLSSFSGNSDPLYVVDGIILNTTSSSGTLISQGEDNSGSDEEINGLLGLNPSDIAGIEILKDASATAIYGALGANGVVLITTKGAVTDKPRIQFSCGMDIHTPYKKMDILSFDEYALYLRDKLDRGVGQDPAYYLTRIFDDTVNLTGLKVQPVDWQDECMHTSVGQRYHLSVSGRQKGLSYAFSAGYNDNPGIIRNTGVKQYTVRLNLDRNISGKVKLGTKTNFAYIDSDLTQGTGGGRMTAATSMIRSMISYRPFSVWDLESIDEEDEDLRAMPSLWINKNHFINTRQEYRITPSIYADWTIIPGLSLRSSLGGDYRYSKRNKFKSGFINSTTTGTNAAVATIELFNWNWDSQINYSKKIWRHTITATGGVSLHSRFSSTETIQGWNIAQYRGQMASINTAPNTLVRYTEGTSTTLSFFARCIYNYFDRHVITATFRADGSSRFSGRNKWAFFPSFAYAWRMSEEKWFKVPIISSAKLRLGWGRVGNQTVADYQTMSTYASDRISSHTPGDLSGVTVAIFPDNLANANLKWETTSQYNIGLDVGLWKGRLSLTADAYYKRTYDLLQAKDIPASTGFTTTYVNEGSISNKGLEFTVEAIPVKTSDWEWTLNGNISVNRNRILSINESAAAAEIWISPTESREVVYFEGQKIGSANYCAQTANIFMEGYPMGLFYGYKIKGIVPEGGSGLPLSPDGAPGTAGQFDYYDLNGNGYLDEEDRCIIGNPNPDFTYGFGTTLSWKGVSLNIAFNGVHGNDILNVNSALETDTNTSGRNIRRDAWKKAWTPENTDTRYPALGKIRSGDYVLISDFYLEDASYLRLSNLSLSYKIPLKKTVKVIKGISLSAAATNLVVWTRYSGWDPEVNSYGTNVRKMGVDLGSYPGNRGFCMDVKLTF